MHFQNSFELPRKVALLVQQKTLFGEEASYMASQYIH